MFPEELNLNKNPRPVWYDIFNGIDIKGNGYADKGEKVLKKVSKDLHPTVYCSVVQF